MNIGLIDVDNTRRFPNIPLMKISAWHKQKGDDVEWYNPMSHYDIVYMSKVFSFTPDYGYHVNADTIIRGGTGYAISLVNGKESYDKTKDNPLSADIEHTFPDYSIYPTLTKDTAFGFLTRGCPRGCKFCHVEKKEGLRTYKVANLSEFWNGQKNIVLCDPNILACKDWKILFQQLIKTKSSIDFNQGLDARLLTEEKCLMLAQMKIKEIHFAWDRYSDKDKILKGLQLFAEYSNKPHGHNGIVYTLVNFDTTFEQDLERIYTLRDMGYWAYVMIYDKPHCSHQYKELSRWVNNRFIFARCQRFEDYKKETSRKIVTNNLFEL